jgi:hypothetical protein
MTTLTELTEPITELLVWHPAANLPDADLTVLAWVQYLDGEDAAWNCWWDGCAWRDCATGDTVAGVVTHYCQPEGPTC